MGAIVLAPGRAGFSRWSISDNQWTDKLDRLAAELPESQWSALPPADQAQEQYTWVKHQPGEYQQAQKFAAVRWKQDGDLRWRYAYRVCQAGDQDSPQAVFERHRLKGSAAPMKGAAVRPRLTQPRLITQTPKNRIRGG